MRMGTPRLSAPLFGTRMAACLVVALALISLAACGGSSQPAGSIKVTMTEYKFDPSQINAKAGKVEFWLVNAGTVSHDMVIADSSGSVVSRSDLVSAGDSFDFTVSNLSAGSYQFYCDVPGHKDAGMVGTLTVT